MFRFIGIGNCNVGNYLKMSRSRLNPIVLHKIVHDNTAVDFEDVNESMLKVILEYCSSHCVKADNIGKPHFLNGQHYLITFDDGNASDYEIVLPMLIKQGCNATFFLITERVGTSGYVTWSQVREIQKSGMSIGSHSVSHHDMKLLSINRQHEELINSRKCIEDKIGTSVKTFSFPFGSLSENLIKIAWDVGYDTLCTSKHGLIKLGARILPRNSINGSMTKSSVLRALNANVTTRITWCLEDRIKYCLKDKFKDNIYKSLRKQWYNIRH